MNEATLATLTCPHCGAKQKMAVPNDYCAPFYKCGSCGQTVWAKKGSCCVICDFSETKCPVSITR